MNINWYPGHMTKSIRMMKENVKLVDAFIYLLDARAAFSCINPQLNGLVEGKPVLFILSKSDLVAAQDLAAIEGRLVGEGKSVLCFSFFNKNAVGQTVAAVKNLCAKKLSKYAAKGAAATVRAMVVGIPNSGKSTLINCLSRTAAAITGNKAGVTRGKQWIKIDEHFELLDTPGTLYPKLVSDQVARRLAYLGSINDDILDFVELALEFIVELDAIDQRFIFDRYKIEGENFDVDDSDELMQGARERMIAHKKLEAIAGARCYVAKGGVADVLKAARALIDDFRKGRLGKIALER